MAYFKRVFILQNIQPGCKYRLVWILPSSKEKTDEIERYELRFTYRVKSLKSYANEEKLIYDREYTLFDEFSVRCKTVSCLYQFEILLVLFNIKQHLNFESL